MRSATLPPIRMNAAETSASKAIADCTLLTVAPMSSTTAAMLTFISEVSTTSTNMAMDSSSATRRSNSCTAPAAVSIGCAMWDLRGSAMGGPSADVLSLPEVAPGDLTRTG